MKIAFIIASMFMLASCDAPNPPQKYEIPKGEQAVNHLLYRIGHLFHKKYHVQPIGTNVAMFGGPVTLLGLDCQIYGPLSREETRKKLIDLVQEFVFLVNSDEAIRPHLKNYPFEINNIEITLFFMDKSGRTLNDPYISIAGISRGKLDYEILITTDIPSIVVSKYIESYEDAVKILKLEDTGTIKNEE